MRASDPVRTVLVANPSADLYGSDRMLLEAVRGLVAGGWSVVVATSVDGPLLRPLREAGARVVLVAAPVVRKSNLTVPGMVALAASVVRGAVPMARVVRDVRPDVMYVNTLSIPFWLAMAQVFRVPAVLHVHEAETAISPMAAHALALPTHLAARIIYNSETSRRAAKQIGSRRARRTRVIHNAVRVLRDTTPARSDVAEPRLGYVGRLSPRKGVDVAVRAQAELIRRGIPAHLRVLGDTFPGYEWYEVELRQLVESEGLQGVVTFPGFVEDVSPEIDDMDILLVPSRGEESFGNVVVEGAIAARPVVASDHSGLREAARYVRAATFVAPDDPIALADAVQAILATWETVRGLAFEDAAVLRKEYAPDRYQAQVTAVLDEVRGVPLRRTREAVTPARHDDGAGSAPPLRADVKPG